MRISSRSKRKLVILMILGVVGAAALTGGLVVRDKQKRVKEAEARAAGVAYHQAGDYAGALKEFDYYLRPKRNKRDAEAVYYLADSRRRVPLANNNHITSSIGWARESVALDPHFRPALELLLDLYSMTGYQTEALDVAEKLIAIDPSHRKALETRVDALSAMRRYDEAFIAAELLADRHTDDPTAHARLLDAMRTTGRPESEISEYVAALVDRHRGEIGFALIDAYARLVAGDVASARDTVLKASHLPIENSEELRRLLRLMDVLGLNDDSARVLEEVRAGGTLGVEALLVGSERAWKEGDLSLALAMLDAEPTLIIDSDDSSLGFAAFLEKISRRDDTAFGDALAARTTTDAVYWNTMIEALVALRTGQPTEAKQTLELLLQAPYRNELVHFLMGETEIALGETRSAVRHLETAARTDPRWLPVQMRLIDLLLSLDETASAYAHAMQAQAVFPGRMVVVQALAKSATAMIERRDAEPDTIDMVVGLLTRLDSELPENAVALAYLSRVYASTGRRDDAEQAMRTLLDSERSMAADEWLSLAAFASRNRLAGVDELLDRGKDRAAWTGVSLLAEAVQAAESGDPERGRAMIEDAIAESDDSELLSRRMMLARYLEHIGDRDATAAYAMLANSYKDNARVQLDVLGSRAAWTDQELIDRTVTRLRTLTGNRALNWRVYEARRLLTFAGDDRSAAEAVTTLTEVLAVDPSRVNALLLASQAFQVLDDDDKAALYLARAVEAAPDRHDLRNTLIAEYQRRGRVSAARTQLDRSMNVIEPLPTQRRRRAQLLLAQGMVDQAVDDIRALGDDLTPADRITLGSLLMRLGRTDEADREIETALEAPEPTLAMIVSAADYFAYRGRLDRADELLARLPSALDDAERIEVLAAFAARTGRLDEAEAHLIGLAESRGGDGDWLGLARIRLRQDDVGGAREAIDAGLQASAGNEQLQKLKEVIAVIPTEESDIRGTIIGVATSPQSVERDALLDAFVIRIDAAAYEKALRQLIDRSPQFLPAWSLLASEMIARGEYHDAAELYVSATDAMPSDPRPAQLAAGLLAQLDRLEPAADMAELWRQRTLEQPMPAELFLAKINADLGQWDRALRLCGRWSETLVSAADTSPGGLELLARCLAATGRTDEAEELLLPRVEADAGWAPALARTAMVSSEPAVARHWLSVARARAGDNEAMLVVGLAWHQLANRTRDPADYTQTVEILSPLADTDAGAAATCAVVFERLEQWSDAERLYRQAIGLNPDDPILRNNLAYLILTHGDGSPDEAVALSERSIALLGSPNVPDEMRLSLMDTLGLAYLAADRAADAERVFLDASAIDADDARVVIGLAEALDAQGRADEARDTLGQIRLDGVADEDLRSRGEALANKLGS